MIEALRGIMCQKVCAASQFSLVLTAGGKVQLSCAYMDMPMTYTYLYIVALSKLFWFLF